MTISLVAHVLVARASFLLYDFRKHLIERLAASRADGVTVRLELRAATDADTVLAGILETLAVGLDDGFVSFRVNHSVFASMFALQTIISEILDSKPSRNKF